MSTSSRRQLVSPSEKNVQENILPHRSVDLFLFSIAFLLLISSTRANEADSISIRTSDSSNGEERCAIYLADSKIPGFGRGVFTGRELGENETVFEATTVLVGNAVAMDTMLAYYVFTDENENFEISMFGPTVLLNHVDQETVDYEYTDELVSHPRQVLYSPYSTHTSFRILSSSNIPAGQELFTDYGVEWFRDRKIKRNAGVKANMSKYSLSELEGAGHCMSDIFVDESVIPLAGKGVFAKKSFRKGEVVSISPVLVLPRHVIAGASDHSVLINYCIVAPFSHNASASDVALLPLGVGGMMNHGGKEGVNIAMDWFEWPSDREAARLATWTAVELEKSQFAPLDIQFIATEDIEAGEELLLSYGTAWELDWIGYLDRLIEWHDMLDELVSQGKNVEELHMIPPQFRSAVAAPEGMFPQSFFMDECLGYVPCDSLPQTSALSDLRTQKNRQLYQQARTFAMENFNFMNLNNNDAAEEL